MGSDPKVSEENLTKSPVALPQPAPPIISWQESAPGRVVFEFQPAAPQNTDNGLEKGTSNDKLKNKAAPDMLTLSKR